MQAQTVKRSITPAGWVCIGLIAILGAGLGVLFGYQTWQLVSFLLPSDAMLMKILAVISFDGFSYLWLASSLFLRRWLLPGSIGWCKWVGGADFVLSLVCSVIQMQIAEAERYIFAIPIQLIYVANFLIIASIVFNLLCIIALVHLQWPQIDGTAKAVAQLPSGDEIAVYADTKQIARQVLKEELDAYFAAKEGPNTDPLAARSFPQTAQTRATAKQKN